MKRSKLYIRVSVILLIASMILCFTACGDDKKSKELKPTESSVETTAASSEATTAPSESTTAPAEDSEDTGIIKKILGYSDDSGIYSIVLTLNNKITDKGVVEMVYDGPKGSAQENSVVCTFRIEYEKTSAGLYEYKTFYNGDVYQNFHSKTEVKVENTFGAGVRGGNVVITYTPDGGETTEIYRADAEAFQSKG